MNSFKRHSSVCVCVTLCMCVWYCVCVCVLAGVEDKCIPHYFKANTWQHCYADVV